MSHSTDNAPRVCLVGVFPPPVHGMSFVNAQMRQRLDARGIAPAVINLSNATLDRSPSARLRRLAIVRAGLREFVRLRPAAVYMSVSGGWGQVYETMFCRRARRANARLFLHHHSYAYLDRPHAVTTRLVKTAGDDATHIVLSEDMANRLHHHYGCRHITAISNAVFTEPVAGRVRPGLRTLGFLGNIAPEKGILEFLGVHAATKLRAIVAGPIVSKRIKTAMLAGVEYVGPKYGDEKRKFFDDIDLLLFPSKYSHEAEPLTVLEAMAHGVPVIATPRGCLPDIVAGGVVPAGKDFVPIAAEQIRRWGASPEEFIAASRAAMNRFHELQRGAARALDELIRQLE